MQTEYNKILKKECAFIINVFPSGDTFSTREIRSWLDIAESYGHDEIYFEDAGDEVTNCVRILSYKIG